MAILLRRSTRIKPGPSGIKVVSRAVATITTSHPRKLAKKEVENGDQSRPLATSVPRKKMQKNRVPKAKQSGALHPDDYAKRVQSAWKIGAHVSAAGGVENTILNAASIRANSFALFVKSQLKWSAPDLSNKSIELFKARLLEFNYSPDHVLPHGNYLINLGNPDNDKRDKSYDCFLDDLKRCELLGLTRYNFHPGSTVGVATTEESIGLIAACLNRAHKETAHVVIVIENMAGSGNVLGSKFEEIAQIIDKVVDKSRVGVCLDTCHMFAAGYDIRSKEAYETTISEFDRVIGLKYLRGMHINDSKATLASAKDRHENIGQGHISLEAFGYIMRDGRLQNIPLILETPTNEDSSVWEKEIEVLNALSTSQSDDTDKISAFKSDIATAVSYVSKRKGGPKASKKGGKRKRVETDSEDGGSEAAV